MTLLFINLLPNIWPGMFNYDGECKMVNMEAICLAKYIAKNVGEEVGIREQKMRQLEQLLHV
jgi:hypothetical protein